MKSFAILAAVAGAALAQEIPMPSGECANLCINNMAQIAESDFQCGASDIACFCTRSNWAFGIRDCTRQACDNQQSASAIEWAYARCAGVAATASGTPEALPILTSAIASATGVSPSSTGDGSDNASSTVAGAVSSAMSGASSMVTSVASSLASDASSVASDISSITSSIAEDASSAISSIESAASSVASSIESAIESATSGATGTGAEQSGEASSTDGEGAAPRVTGMSFAAGAGIAAWLLL